MTNYLYTLKNGLKALFFFIACQLTFLNVTYAMNAKVEEPIKIGSYLTPGLIEQNGSGLFNQLNNAIFKEVNKNNELILTSLNRARLGIKNGTLDGYFPELWENLPGDRKQYVVSRPIFYKRIILFTHIDSNLSRLSDFTNEALGVVQGFSYGKKITTNPLLNFAYQKNDIINIKLLLNKRIGGVLGGYPGTVNAVKENNGKGIIQYDLNKPVAILESFYVCQNNADGIKLCNAIDKAIQSLLNNGALELNEITGVSHFNSAKLL